MTENRKPIERPLAPPHDERRPNSGFIGEAAQAVAIHCLLPTPRGLHWWSPVTRSLRGSFNESQESCAARQVRTKAAYYANIDTPYSALKPEERINRHHDGVFEHIMHHARHMASEGVKQCQVRDVDFSG